MMSLMSTTNCLSTRPSASSVSPDRPHHMIRMMTSLVSTFPQREQSRFDYENFDADLSLGVDHVISLLKDKGGVEQLPNLENDQIQKCANALDAFLDEKTLGYQTRVRYLKYLRRLCGTIGILPSSFILADTIDGHGTTPFATGGYGEVVGWKWLQHENILPFVGVTPKFAIVSDFMENGNIMGFIEKHPRYNRLHLLVGTASGLEYLHGHGIVHGDLKGANILVDSRYSARLADFGLTAIVDESTAGSTTGGGEPRGTTRWMAPEMLWPEKFKFPGDVQKRLPSKSTDIYALGMTTLEVLTGRRPFDNIKNATVILEVTRGRKPDRPASGFSD
ncbi:kinase-like protein, partial [Thelephora ganbajun]